MQGSEHNSMKNGYSPNIEIEYRKSKIKLTAEIESRKSKIEQTSEIESRILTYF